MEAPSRVFAVVPAAGLSRRMGHPKLLLPIQGTTVMRRLLAVLDRPEITATFVVVRQQDSRLRDEIGPSKATIVSGPTDPPDMRESVLRALAEIRRLHSPRRQDAWLLVPADHPVLEASILDTLLDGWNRGASRIVVPTYQGRRGHPTLFRWELADEVAQIPANEGINRLVRGYSKEITEVEIDNPGVIVDLDTPEDYEKLLRRLETE